MTADKVLKTRGMVDIWDDAWMGDAACQGMDPEAMVSTARTRAS